MLISFRLEKVKSVKAVFLAGVDIALAALLKNKRSLQTEQ